VRANDWDAIPAGVLVSLTYINGLSRLSSTIRPLVWALTGWDRRPAGPRDNYHEVVEILVAAGANVTPDLLAWDRLKADPKMLSALQETHIE